METRPKKTGEPGRRRLIRALGVGGTGVVISRWVKPVVDSVVLPLHAQASPTCGGLPLGSPGKIVASMTWTGSAGLDLMGLALISSDCVDVDFPTSAEPPLAPLVINESGLPDETYSLLAGMVGIPTIDVTITLTTERGTQVFNVTVPEAPAYPNDFTVIATLTIPGGACPAGSGLFGDACGGFGGGLHERIWPAG